VPPDVGSMSRTVFIRYYVMIGRPFAELEPEFTSGAGRWLPSMAERANGHGLQLLSELGFQVGRRRIARKIEVTVGDPRRETGVTLLPLHWRAASESGLFPTLEGQIEIANLGLATTQIGISANYDPPMGLIGNIADRALMHRVAEATVRDFMERIRDRLERPGRT
jgi:hypothetical protein